MSQPPVETPPLAEPPPTGPRWQFGLKWLFFLMMTVAALAALGRYTAGHPLFVLFVLAVYFLSLSGLYLLLRGRILLYRHALKARRLRENRRKLAEWTKSKSTAGQSDKVSPNP